MLATDAGAVDKCKALLEHKAEISIKRTDGKTVLDIAMEKKQDAIVKLLIPPFIELIKGLLNTHGFHYRKEIAKSLLQINSYDNAILVNILNELKVYLDTSKYYDLIADCTAQALKVGSISALALFSNESPRRVYCCNR